MDHLLKENVTEEELLFIKLKYDWSDIDIRLGLAYSGYCLNILEDDPEMRVQLAVAAVRNYDAEEVLRTHNSKNSILRNSSVLNNHRRRY